MDELFNEPEEYDFWKLCDTLSVVHAALLIAGEDPNDFPYLMRWDIDKRPKRFNAVFTALKNAINSKKLNAIMEYDDNFNSPSVDWEETIVEVTDLKEWLKSRGFCKGFFFPLEGNSDLPKYLDKNHHCYAPKLAAAVNAWEAVSSNCQAIKGKSVKQTIGKWVREHAAQFQLTDEDGKQNESGINEVIKVANWDIKGGAPRTPTE